MDQVNELDKIMFGDFVCTSANDGTTYFRPVTARAQTLWQEQNFNRFVIDILFSLNWKYRTLLVFSIWLSSL